jgi:hypothetical protein
MYQYTDIIHTYYTNTYVVVTPEREAPVGHVLDIEYNT